MTEPLDLDAPESHAIVRAALEAFMKDFDYDTHKAIACGEEDGVNRYDETTSELIAQLRKHLADKATRTPTASPLDLDAIQARCDAATPGPWHVEDDKQDLNRWVADRTGYLEINFGYLNNGTQPDARFVAAARTDVEQLLARVRELEAERALYVGVEPTIAEEMAELTRGYIAAHAVCDAAEKQATRWENPLPVPEWVAAVRAALDGHPEPAPSGPQTAA